MSATTAAKRKEVLAALIDKGLGFLECQEAFGVDREEDPHARYAFEHYHQDKELEVDPTTVVARIKTDPDASYVLCWRRVTDIEAGVHKKDEKPAT